MRRYMGRAGRVLAAVSALSLALVVAFAATETAFVLIGPLVAIFLVTGLLAFAVWLARW